MVARKETIGWRVKTSDGLYVVRRFLSSVGYEGLVSEKRRPAPLSQYEAVKLMLAWMECGYRPSLIRVTRKAQG